MLLLLFFVLCFVCECWPLWSFSFLLSEKTWRNQIYNDDDDDDDNVVDDEDYLCSMICTLMHMRTKRFECVSFSVAHIWNIRGALFIYSVMPCLFMLIRFFVLLCSYFNRQRMAVVCVSCVCAHFFLSHSLLFVRFICLIVSCSSRTLLCHHHFMAAKINTHTHA